jgi:hypothetical protein
MTGSESESKSEVKIRIRIWLGKRLGSEQIRIRMRNTGSRTDRNRFLLSPLAFLVSYYLNLSLCPFSSGGVGSSKCNMIPAYSNGNGETCQCWHDEIAALAVFILHLELHPLLWETSKWKLETD